MDAENTWRRLHEANWVETVTRVESNYYYNPVTRQLQRIPSVLDEELSDPTIYRMRYEPRYTYIRIAHEDPTDALIPKNSQLGVPGLLDAVEAKGAGHLEQGNHPEVRRAFESIFMRQREEFHTPQRR